MDFLKTSKRKYAVAILMMAAVFFIVSPAIQSVKADYQDGFDGYGAVTLANGQTVGNIWTATSTSPGCLTDAVVNDARAFTLPNDFEISLQSGCAVSTNSATMAINVNASSSITTLSWYQSLLAVSGTGASTKSGYPATIAIYTVSFCQSTTNYAVMPSTTSCIGSPTTIYTNDTSTICSPAGHSMAGCVTPQSVWSKIRGSVNTNAGTQYTFSFKISIIGSSNIYTFSFGLDTIQFTSSVSGSTTFGGANAIQLSQPTFIMMDYSSGQWFNVSNYAQSRVYINYSIPVSAFLCPSPLVITSKNVCTLNNVAIPDQVISMASTTLATVVVGSKGTCSAYARSIIPSPAASENIVYLDNPCFLLGYQIAVSDTTGNFPAGSQVYIQTGNSATARVISSGYLDSQNSFAVSLQAGTTYTLRIVSGSHTYSTFFTPSTTQTTISVTIQGVAYSQPAGAIQNIQLGQGWGCYRSSSSSIAGFFVDQGTSTSWIYFTLGKINATGYYAVSSINDSSGPYGSAQANFTSVATTYKGQSITAQYVMSYTAKTSYATTPTGTVTYGPLSVVTGIPKCQNNFPSYLIASWNAPASVFGLNQVIPGAGGQAWGEMIALTIMTLTATTIGARMASFGYIILAAESVGFWLFGLLPLSYTLVAAFMFSSVIGFLVFRSRRTAQVGQ